MSRLISGVVASDKADKTIVIQTTVRKTHPIYKKQYTRNRKFMAHDEKNEAKIGDLVLIRESKPVSARKRFTLEKILHKASAGYVETDAAADIPVEIAEEQGPASKQAKNSKPQDDKPVKDAE
jgi:small subunit ribosomal protein S17